MSLIEPLIERRSALPLACEPSKRNGVNASVFSYCLQKRDNKFLLLPPTTFWNYTRDVRPLRFTVKFTTESLDAVEVFGSLGTTGPVLSANLLLKLSGLKTLQLSTALNL